MPELLQVAFLLAAFYGFNALHRIASAAEGGKFQAQNNYINSRSTNFNACEIKQVEATDAP